LSLLCSEDFFEKVSVIIELDREAYAALLFKERVALASLAIVTAF